MRSLKKLYLSLRGSLENSSTKMSRYSNTIGMTSSLKSTIMKISPVNRALNSINCNIMLSPRNSNPEKLGTRNISLFFQYQSSSLRHEKY